MKDCKKLKEKFIKKCKEKFTKSDKTYKEIGKSINMTESSVKDFFENKSDSKISTVIKILNILNYELKL